MCTLFLKSMLFIHVAKASAVVDRKGGTAKRVVFFGVCVFLLLFVCLFFFVDMYEQHGFNFK